MITGTIGLVASGRPTAASEGLGLGQGQGGEGGIGLDDVQGGEGGGGGGGRQAGGVDQRAGPGLQKVDHGLGAQT
jgi:hypothetical protein